jgi:hypothetical protein
MRLYILILVLVTMMIAPQIPLTRASDEVDDEVFLLATEKELLAFSSRTGQWVVQDYRPQEQVVKIKYGGKVGVVFTNLRIFGFSSLTNEWVEEPLMVKEKLESLEASGKVGAVITNRRALGFSAKIGKWTPKMFRPE